ncbi:MAG: methylenetetrahydrofolate reductase [Spirochaetaceae bacterium]|jgi:methylenetetrahydrofolate reductase (NADPH)|nr:methylenetetrahydrofolate reductase [Spirochaetaceae bacterium]
MVKPMKISDILNTGRVTVSCELFPPKHGSGMADAQNVVRETASLRPSFISITYGAGGGTSNHTASLAVEAQKHGIPALAHLTCVSSDRQTIRGVLSKLAADKIENILALRGDIPNGQSFPTDAQYHHACDLMKEIQSSGDFCVGGACYPEGHPESESLEKDIESLKIKADCGCRFLTTQMFFDNNILYNFLYRLLHHKIDVPVIAGIMPVTDRRQIARICKISGTVLPQRFRAIVDKFSGNSAAMNQAGIAYATEQIIDLIANDVRNIHIYTMNKPDIAGRIMNNLSEIFK